MKPISSRLWDALTSLKLAIACLALLMVLVVACTLAQVQLGTWGAVNAYIRSFFIYWNVAGTGWSIPVFPGGGLVGLVLGMAASRLLSAIVYHATAQDPFVLAAVALTLLLTGSLSVAGPVRRALHIDPANVLREQ